MEHLQNRDIPAENPVYRDLLEATIQMNIEIIPSPGEELEPKRKSLGFIIWYNVGNFVSRTMPNIFSNKEIAQTHLDGYVSRHPQFDEDSYSVKEIFA